MAKRNLAVLEWIANNRGAIARIAQQTRRSNASVSMILHGKRKSEDGRVERLLREAGAPIPR